MSKEKDFFKTCFNTVASLEVKNESQAIAKEVVLSEIEQLQQENKRLNSAIQTYDILLKFNVEANNQLKLINKEHQQINGELRQANKLLNEQYIRLYKEYLQVKENWNKLKEFVNKMHEYFLYTDVNEVYKQSMKLDNQFPNLFNASDRILSSICRKMQELEQGSNGNE